MSERNELAPALPFAIAVEYAVPDCHVNVAAWLDPPNYRGRTRAVYEPRGSQ